MCTAAYLQLSSNVPDPRLVALCAEIDEVERWATEALTGANRVLSRVRRLARRKDAQAPSAATLRAIGGVAVGDLPLITLDRIVAVDPEVADVMAQAREVAIALEELPMRGRIARKQILRISLGEAGLTLPARRELKTHGDTARETLDSVAARIKRLRQAFVASLHASHRRAKPKRRVSRTDRVRAA